MKKESMLGLSLNLLLLLMVMAAPARAELKIEITEGISGAVPLAVVPFGYEGAGPPPLDVAAVVAADLARSGRFAPVESSRMLEKPTIGRDVDFALLRDAGFEILDRLAEAAAEFWQAPCAKDHDHDSEHDEEFSRSDSEHDRLHSSGRWSRKSTSGSDPVRSAGHTGLPRVPLPFSGVNGH